MRDRPRIPARLRDAGSPGEGTVFAIPLPNDEYVLGVVIARYPRVIRAGLSLDPISELPPSNVLLTAFDLESITQVDASALDDGKWPLVGVIEDFDAALWPNPPFLPGERADEAQAPTDLEHELADSVRRDRLRGVRDDDLIFVDSDQGRRYAERVLGRGHLLAKMVRDTLDFEAGSFAATFPFIEMRDTPQGIRDGDWASAEYPGQVDDHGGWGLRSGAYQRALVSIVHRFLADPAHTVIFDWDRLDLAREDDVEIWQRIETERHGPLQLFPLQVFYRDDGSKREMYAAVGGGKIDEATSESVIRDTFDPVCEIACMLAVDIAKLPRHALPVDLEALASLAQLVKGLALRHTPYDGYLIWQRP